VSALPGLILYTVRVKRRSERPQRARAAQAVAVSGADVQEALIAARRDLRDTLEQEEADGRRVLIIAGASVLLLIGAAIFVGSGGTAAPAEATLIAGATGATVGTVVATEVVAAEVISLAAARVAAGVAVETIRQAAPRIAAAVTIYLAGRELDARPETAGLCIEAGCDVGEALGGESL